MTTAFKDRNLIAVIGDEVRRDDFFLRLEYPYVSLSGFYHWSPPGRDRPCQRTTEEEFPSCGL